MEGFKDGGGFDSHCILFQMIAELCQAIAVGNFPAVFLPKEVCSHIRFLQLLLKISDACLEVLKTSVTIGGIPAVEPVVQFRVFQSKKCIDTQRVFRSHLQIALNRGWTYGVHVGHLSYRQAVLVAR